MARLFLTIMILFMAVGPIAHGYLAFKFNATQTLVAEEETHDDKPQGKTKADLKNDFQAAVSFHQHSVFDGLKSSHDRYLIFLSKGYAGIPLRPPDVI